MLFNHTPDELLRLCGHTLDLAKQSGATSAEADFSESLGQSVSVRLGEIEQIEFQQDKSLDITVYVGQRKGRASTADFSERALQDTVKAAIDIARYTAEDDCAGLADAVAAWSPATNTACSATIGMILPAVTKTWTRPNSSVKPQPNGLYAV